MGFAVRYFVTFAARQNIGQRGFTRTVWPHDRVHLARANLKVYTFQDLLFFVFKFDVQVFNLQHFIPSLPNHGRSM